MKYVFYLFLILTIAWLGFADEEKNADRPLKGNWDFAPELQWESSSAGGDALVRITAVRVDGDGTTFVYDSKYSKFFVFSTAGEFLYEFGKQGEGPGEYRRVFDFFLVDGNIVVPDMNKIHFFDKKGGFIRSEMTGGSMIRPRAFLDAANFLTVPFMGDDHKGNDRLDLFNLKTKKRTTLFEFPQEKNIEATVSGRQGTMRLVVRDDSTTPGIVCLTDGKDLYFGKNDRYLIKKTDANGQEVFSFSLQGRDRKEVTMAMKKKRFENFTINGRRPDPEMLRQLTENIPDRCTYFNRIHVDTNGNIWVFVPDLGNENGQEIDIFSPAGKYLYHAELKLPENYEFSLSGFDVTGDRLTLFAEDEAGDGLLVRYRIRIPD